MSDTRGRYVRPKRLADRLDVSERQLQRWRSEGGGPPFVRLGRQRLVRYQLANVEQWEREHGPDQP